MFPGDLDKMRFDVARVESFPSTRFREVSPAQAHIIAHRAAAFMNAFEIGHVRADLPEFKESPNQSGTNSRRPSPTWRAPGLLGTPPSLVHLGMPEEPAYVHSSHKQKSNHKIDSTAVVSEEPGETSRPAKSNRRT
jgi:hypothetical protein